jgi:hypothetical protein
VFDHLQNGIYGIQGKYIQNVQRNKASHRIAQSKRAQGEKAYYQAKLGPTHAEKKSPNPNQMISK